MNHLLNIRKLLQYITFVGVRLLILILVTGSVSACLEPQWPYVVRELAGFSREKFDDRNQELMERDEAVKLVATRLWSATASCSYFLDSRYQMPLNWAVMMDTEECPEYDFWDCKDRVYVRKSKVDNCLIATGFFIIACEQDEGAVIATHYNAFSICSDALESYWTDPVLILP